MHPSPGGTTREKEVPFGWELCYNSREERREAAIEKTLYVSDLDGTLLTPEQRLSPFTVRVLEYLLGQGVAFTYATARSGYSAAAVTQGLESPLPVILYNGAFVRLGPQGEVLLRQGFSPEQREAVKNLLARWEIQPLVYTLLEGKERVRWVPGKETPGAARYLESRQGDPRLLPAQEASLYEGEVFYFTCIGEREQLFPAWEALRRLPGVSALLQEEIYRPGEFWLEVMAAGATKAHGAQLLKQRLGCTRMVAFGDGLNDLPLFQAADASCVVANALPEVRSAGEVIPGNREDGVARWLLADSAPALALGERAGKFRLRLYRPADLEELIWLFYHSVHTAAWRDYTPEELDAWAASPESVDRAAWGESLAAHYTVVAEQDGKLLGFGDMDETGYLDRLYVHGEFQGQGVAASIAQALEGFARGLGVERVAVHASRTARGFFQSRGFRVVKAQQVERRGVLLENFVMERQLETA